MGDQSLVHCIQDCHSNDECFEARAIQVPVVCDVGKRLEESQAKKARESVGVCGMQMEMSDGRG